MNEQEMVKKKVKKEKPVRRFSVLYKTEYVSYIVFCLAIIAAQIFFYIYYKDGTSRIPPSSPEDLIPSIFMLGLMIFVIQYLAKRTIIMDNIGVTYKTVKNQYHIDWKDVKYVKVTLNSNDRVGRGSYIVIAEAEYALQYTDFRAARDGFIVMRYRNSILEEIKKHYDGDVFRATAKK